MFTGDQQSQPKDDILRLKIEDRIGAYSEAEGKLDLHGISIDTNHLRQVLPRLKSLFGLHTLDISHNGFGDAGAEVLAISEHISILRNLNISYNQIGSQGIQALADSEYLSGLNTLDIGANSIGDSEAQALAESKHLSSLHALYLHNNRIRDKAAMAFVRSEHLLCLCALYMSHNWLGDPQIIIELCDRLLDNRKAADEKGIKCASRIDVTHNSLQWRGMDAPISKEVLREMDPKKLINRLLSVRECGNSIAAARAVTVGVSGSGKTHLRRRLVEGDSAELRKPLDEHAQGHDTGDGKFTKGIFPHETHVPVQQHSGGKLQDVMLVVVDVGGHREQLRSHHNYVYLSGPSVFLLCLHARMPFDGWGRYYLDMIQELTRLRLSKIHRQPLGIEDLRGLIRAEEKTPVVIVPTHSDVPRTSNDLKLPAALASAYPLLELVVSREVNNLSSKDSYTVRHCISQQLEKLPAVRSVVMGYVVPIRYEVRKRFGMNKLKKLRPLDPPASISLNEITEICKRHNTDEVDYVVRELLRLGDVVARLRDIPDEDTPVSNRIDRLMNPQFLTKYLYKVVMDPLTRQNRGFMTLIRFDEITFGLNPGDRDLLQDMLKEYLIVVRHEKFGQEAGFFVPDLFEPRPDDQFEPWDDAVFDQILAAETFMPEHAFFEFLTYCEKQDWLEPIDKKRCVYLFRDACLLTAGEVKAQVYANVLERKFRVLAKGPRERAVEFGQRLQTWFIEEIGIVVAGPKNHCVENQQSPMDSDHLNVKRSSINDSLHSDAVERNSGRSSDSDGAKDAKWQTNGKLREAIQKLLEGVSDGLSARDIAEDVTIVAIIGRVEKSTIRKKLDKWRRTNWPQLQVIPRGRYSRWLLRPSQATKPV